ncbi:MAG: hypothetical protein GMKNLPBB_02082 [Myxococcota bacterium]|nr:hypothetical protein [Myxococcota bacterium]
MMNHRASAFALLFVSISFLWSACGGDSKPDDAGVAGGAVGDAGGGADSGPALIDPSSADENASYLIAVRDQTLFGGKLIRKGADLNLTGGPPGFPPAVLKIEGSKAVGAAGAQTWELEFQDETGAAVPGPNLPVNISGTFKAGGKSSPILGYRLGATRTQPITGAYELSVTGITNGCTRFMSDGVVREEFKPMLVEKVNENQVRVYMFTFGVAALGGYSSGSQAFSNARGSVTRDGVKIDLEANGGFDASDNSATVRVSLAVTDAQGTCNITLQGIGSRK